MAELRDLASITFEIPGHVVGKNAAYRDRYSKVKVEGGKTQTVRLPGRGAKTKDAKLYARRIYAAALSAKLACEPRWPLNPWKVARVRIDAQQYDDRHDSDAKCLLIQDALRGLLYGDDSCVGWGSNDPDGPIFDGRGPRVVVRVTLRALRSDDEAEYLQRNEQRLALNKHRRRNGLKQIPKEKPPKGGFL